MIRTAILAALAVALFASNAEARHSHVIIAHDRCNIDWPCEGVINSPRGEMVVKAMRGFGSAQKIYRPHEKPRTELYNKAKIATNALGRPFHYIAGRLVCAINVGAALAERGIKGTGSALAMSYLHWGRSAGGPVPGAVIISGRRGGGHVAIVSRVDHGVVYAWNATGGQNGWREIPYHLHVIDYRVPG